MTPIIGLGRDPVFPIFIRTIFQRIAKEIYLGVNMHKYICVTVIIVLFTGCIQYNDYTKGASCYKENKYAEAFTYFQRAAYSRDAQSQCYLGIMYEFGQGVNQDDLQAIKWYKESARNGCLISLDNLGRLYLKKNNFTEAATCFEQAAKQGYLPSLYRMGVLYEDGTGVEKDLAKAESMYKIVADRGEPISQNALAYRWAEQNKNLEEAERLIKLVLKNNHQHLYDSNYMDTYGFVLYKQGKYEEAIKQFEKAMGISPDNATIHNHLGDCYVKINKTDKAKEQYLKALELKPMTPDDKLNDQIRAKLDALEQAPADPLN